MKTPRKASKPPVCHVVEINAVYSIEAAQVALGLRRTSLRREARAGRLRVSKRAGKYYILGTWLLEWLAVGEHRPTKPAAA
jgi:hypothetical protein